MTYGSFIHAAAYGAPTAHFGVVSSSALRNKFDRLMTAINSLGNSMRVGHAIDGTIADVDYLNWLTFVNAWHVFFRENYPTSVLWNSDEEWAAVEAYNQDYLQWRNFYETQTQKQAPPATTPSETPPPPQPKAGAGLPFGAFGQPLVDTTPIGIGLGIAGLAILTVWASKGR